MTDDDYDRAEQGACLMVALGCTRVSVVQAVVWWRRQACPDLFAALEEDAA